MSHLFDPGNVVYLNRRYWLAHCEGHPSHLGGWLDADEFVGVIVAAEPNRGRWLERFYTILCEIDGQPTYIRIEWKSLNNRPPSEWRGHASLV